ncbi:Rha family transcriptional regulator [Rhizobium rhizogenes]|uniref:Rha family transcriptional regulator n=1 Tax=Rhizobium rhizogenes TaxID=359 RepID=UPI00191CA38B|nr:Rha family transcriptional regulator [Rhizobium rhizogenes]
MNMLISTAITMSSREIAELTGKRHPDVKRDIERMLSDLSEDVSKFAHIYLDSMNRDQTEYRLDRDLTETLLLGYSALLRLKVIRRLREMEAALAAPRPMTTAEIVLQNAQALVDFERRQSAVELRVDMIASMTSLTAKPQSTETKSEIKARINKQYGLPAWLVDEVLTSISYRPPVFAMVKNSHENALGSSFADYQIVDITKLFKRFVSECQHATATTATHPGISGRFKLLRRE